MVPPGPPRFHGLLTNSVGAVTDTSGFDSFENLLFETGSSTTPLRFG